MNSFGIFQTYYVDFLNRSDSDVSWIGSVQVFIVFFIGTFTGRFTDAGYFRPVFGKFPSFLSRTISEERLLGLITSKL